MSEYDELVKRLRLMLPQSVGPEAAGAIEALVDEVAALKSALDRAGNPQLPRPASAYVEMRDERDALKAEVERLKGALEAFVKHFGPLEDNAMLHEDVRKCYRLARSALEAKP